MSERIQNVQPKEYNGIKYRSTLEAKTAKVLNSLSIPFEYETRKIVLQEGFYSPFQKNKVRELTYTPDFIIGPIMLECKGFETPEWKIKRKLLFKWLKENEPDTIFYQVHDARKQLIEALDSHWSYLGYTIQVTPKPKKAKGKFCPNTIKCFESIKEAKEEIGLKGKSTGPILRCLLGEVQYVYNYNWKLKRVIL